MTRKDAWDDTRDAGFDRLDVTGNSHLRALGEEYVRAFRAGASAREMAEENPFSVLKPGRVLANPMWEVHDREIRRGISLAKALEFNKPRPVVEDDR